MYAKLKDGVYQGVLIFIYILLTFACLYPFYYLFINSLSDPVASAKGIVLWIPKGFTLNNYIEIFKLKGILGATFISVLRTVAGTFLTVFMCSMFAYYLTKSSLKGAKWIYRATIVTMYVNAGIIPWFITMKMLGLANNFLLYILPTTIAPFTVVLVKTYIEQLSQSLEEAARIDGAGYFTILLRIILPVCKPVITAVVVFSAVGQWNAWQDNFFLVENPNLQTLQMMLMNYLKEAESVSSAVMNEQNIAMNAQAARSVMTPFTVKTTITMVVTIPIILVYPFLQKYFVSGIMIGAVKG